MIIIGIDPGTARMGYAVMKHAASGKNKNEKPTLIEVGVVTTPSDIEMHDRLAIIFSELNKIGKKHSLSVMVIEKLFFNTNVKTAMTVGQSRGVSLLFAANSGLKVFEYTALQAKLILTGYGRSDKKEMQDAVMKHLGLPTCVKPDDANDAVAMVLCHLSKISSKVQK